MNLDVTFDQSEASLPAGFVSDVEWVANYFDGLFTNDVTVNIDVGYGEIDGEALFSDALGESLPSADNKAGYVYTDNYYPVDTALKAEDAPGSSTLRRPANKPLAGKVAFTAAEAKALGLISSNPGPDGYVGFASAANLFSYANGTPAAGRYDFIGVVEHEFTEVMGRISLANDESQYYSPMDLYRFTAPHTHDEGTGGNGSTAYFSIDGGKTDLGTWNNQTSNGDLGDWYPAGPAPGGDDAFNDYSYPGVVNELSSSDLTVMQAIGWTTGGETSAAASSGLANATEGGATEGGLGLAALAGGDTVDGSIGANANFASDARLLTAPSGTSNDYGSSDRIGIVAGTAKVELHGDDDTVAAGFQPGDGAARINLTGSSGDVIALGGGAFADTVVGFDQAAGDRIRLTTDSVHQVVAHSSWLVHGGQDAEIALSDGSTLILKGVTDLTGSFFV
ncbi:MAG TPA: NF038122 family metalloprotease [Stellaceae bacterium]|nr:NF038122 family metalloprotease [Stellaceae bacterium]